jgi:hypothetical protein
MKEDSLSKLLHEPKEKDWFDFKSTLKLYQSDGKLVERQRDELLKDILGLANGNSHIIRKTKYLLVLTILSLMKAVAGFCIMLITRRPPLAIYRNGSLAPVALQLLGSKVTLFDFKEQICL